MADTPKKLLALAGTVGRVPKRKVLESGDAVVDFSIAVNNGYGDDAPSPTWFDIAVWNEGLQKSVMTEVAKGSKVAVEGFYSSREYEGTTYHKINASRVGLIEWLARTKRTAAQQSAPSSPAPASDVDW